MGPTGDQQNLCQVWSPPESRLATGFGHMDPEFRGSDVGSGEYGRTLSIPGCDVRATQFAMDV